MIHKLLFWLSDYLVLRVIRIDDQPYMERYYIGKLFGVTFYLHRFVGVDSERHLHNHPWRRSVSVVLARRYVEEIVTDFCHLMPNGLVSELRVVRWFNVISGSKFHRITATEPNTWTLFMHGARQRVTTPTGHEVLKGWGFLNAEPTPKNGTLVSYSPALFPVDHYWHLANPTGKNHPERSA